MFSPVASTVDEITHEFLLQLRLARASELARMGLLLRAQELLMHRECLPKTSEELDLLARISVQQGRYSEALKRWQHALQISQGRLCYQDAIKSLNRHIAICERRKKATITGISVLYLVTLIVLTSTLIRGPFNRTVVTEVKASPQSEKTAK